MNDEKQEIATIKKALKENGFVIKGQTCYFQLKSMCFIVFFQKRLDGIYNTNLGIILNSAPQKYSFKCCDIGWVYWSTDKSVDEKISNILLWFENRNTLPKILEQYKNHNLSDFITPNGKQILGI
jgi:hypothetical protein